MIFGRMLEKPAVPTSGSLFHSEGSCLVNVHTLSGSAREQCRDLLDHLRCEQCRDLLVVRDCGALLVRDCGAILASVLAFELFALPWQLFDFPDTAHIDNNTADLVRDESGR